MNSSKQWYNIQNNAVSWEKKCSRCMCVAYLWWYFDQLRRNQKKRIPPSQTHMKICCEETWFWCLWWATLWL